MMLKLKAEHIMARFTQASHFRAPARRSSSQNVAITPPMPRPELT
jgi:hypothetical protein